MGSESAPPSSAMSALTAKQMPAMSALSAFYLACANKNPPKGPPGGYVKGFGCFGHEASGVTIRSEPIQLTPISDRDIVLYHYTDHAGFSAITGSKMKHLRASYAERAHCGDGIYTSQHPPDFFGTKESILLNNYTNASDTTKQQRQIKFWQEKGAADYCLPLVVSRDLAVNVCTEMTKEMTRPGHTLNHGPIRKGRDIWVVVILDGNDVVPAYEEVESVHFRLWKSGDFSMRLDAVEIFAGHAAMGDMQATTNVLKSLHDDDFNVRTAAIWATVGAKALTASEKAGAITELAQNEPVEVVLDAIKEALTAIEKNSDPEDTARQTSPDVIRGTNKLNAPSYRTDQEDIGKTISLAPALHSFPVDEIVGEAGGFAGFAMVSGGGKCDSGSHDMILSDDVKSAYQPYVCNGCGQGFLGSRWFCPTCQDDYCFFCRPYQEDLTSSGKLQLGYDVGRLSLSYARVQLSSYHFGMAASTVVVASTAAMKVGVVKRLLGEGFEAEGGRVQGVKAASGINEQPFGHEETILGAKNRLASAKTLAPDANLYVAIENGIFEVKTPESKFYDVAWVIMENSRGQQALTHSVGIEFPAKWVLEAREEGFDKTHAGHKFAADNPGANVQDPHQLLTVGRACREDLLHGALLAAWGQLQYKSAHVEASQIMPKTSPIQAAALHELAKAIDNRSPQAYASAKWRCEETRVAEIDIERVLRQRRTESEDAGISMAYILSEDFENMAREAAGKEDPTFLEMAEPLFKQGFGGACMGEGMLCPRDLQPGCSFIDSLPSKYRKRATHFMSWVWRYKLSTLRSCLTRWAETNALNLEDVFLYVCFFCNNQWRILIEKSTQATDNLERVFEARLHKIGKAVALIDSWSKSTYITRIWTIYEQYVIAKLGIEVQFALPAEQAETLIKQLDTGKEGLELVIEAISNVDAESAEATMKQDEDNVKDLIRTSIGFTKVNSQVQLSISEWIFKEFVAQALKASR